MSCDGPHVPQVDTVFFYINGLKLQFMFIVLLQPSIPQVYMYETNPNTRINLLVDNAKLSSDLAIKSLPKVFT